jgi:hypothetical protein
MGEILKKIKKEAFIIIVFIVVLNNIKIPVGVQETNFSSDGL